MTIYNWREDNLPVADVWDANGAHVSCCIEVNTATGEIHRYVCNRDGSFPIAPDGESCVTEKITVPAPLRVEFGEHTVCAALERLAEAQQRRVT